MSNKTIESLIFTRWLLVYKHFCWIYDLHIFQSQINTEQVDVAKNCLFTWLSAKHTQLPTLSALHIAARP